jgi:hypothetical protein
MPFMKCFNRIFISVFIVFMFISATGYSQYQNLGNVQKSEYTPNPWFVGGMIGGSFSNSGGSFEIAPLVGYKVTEDFHVGSRLTYIYSSYDYGGYIGKQSLNHYGGSLFARHKFLNMLFAHVEYEILSVEYVADQSGNSRKTINSLFVGGGLFQQVGGRGFATVAILYNLLETEYSPYSNPVIRIGFGVGL